MWRRIKRLFHGFLSLFVTGLEKANPKALMGYSDITALHLAVAAWGDTITFYSNGALGVGGLKMKIHKAAVSKLFEAHDQVLDAEEIYALGRQFSGA